MEKEKNIYGKLQATRVALQKRNIKKTGVNKFSGYTYFELGDFLPSANEVLLDHGLFTRVFFREKYAYLIVYNIDNPKERIVFTSPMADAVLKGTHPIQNIGAVETYQRRYLYMLALEIVESDFLDATTGANSNAHLGNDFVANKIEKATPNQLKAIFAAGRQVMSDENLKDYIFGKYQVNSSKELTKEQAKELLAELNKMKKEAKNDTDKQI